MNRLARCLFVLLVLGILTQIGPGSAGAQGILSTKHNLSATGTQSIRVASGTAEVCVFCHTPHAADTTIAAPLWNRRVNTTSAYTMYNSPTLDSQPDRANMGVSLACLSCHDGTIAFDALRNLPGSGGFDANPAAAGVTNWTFQNAPTKMMPAGAITNIGTDLTNDHPIAMLYSDARSPSSGSESETSGFNNALTTSGREWVQNTALNTQLPLYSGRVQCASCHDPHRTTTTFLRVANDESRLCRTCHRKDG